MIGPFIRSPYNYDRREASRFSGVDTGTDTPTQQSQEAQANINNIVANFIKTGMVPVVEGRIPLEVDFADIFDFQDAQNTIAQAQSVFMELPAQMRSEFNNDAGRFVAFCSDPDNKEKMYKMGLAIRPKPEDTPVVVKTEETKS